MNIESKIMQMIIEAKSPYNDGYVSEDYKQQLLAIKEMIERAFPNE
jgi:hypothetical protein